VRPLAPSPAWTLVTPYCKRTRPGRGANTKAAGFPPLSRPSPAASLPPFALAHALDPSGLEHAATLTRRLRDPPVSKRRHDVVGKAGSDDREDEEIREKEEREREMHIRHESREHDNQ
jgi:hypothetical protein